MNFKKLNYIFVATLCFFGISQINSMDIGDLEDQINELWPFVRLTNTFSNLEQFKLTYLNFSESEREECKIIYDPEKIEVYHNILQTMKIGYIAFLNERKKVINGFEEEFSKKNKNQLDLALAEWNKKSDDNCIKSYFLGKEEIINIVKKYINNILFKEFKKMIKKMTLEKLDIELTRSTLELKNNYDSFKEKQLSEIKRLLHHKTKGRLYPEFNNK